MRYHLPLFLLATMMLVTAHAQETAKPEAPVESPVQAAPETAAPGAEESAEASPPVRPRSPANAPAAAERFEPTEKVRADFDVSFPVDI